MACYSYLRRIIASKRRKSRKDRNDEWKTVWKTLLPSYPRHAESDPSHDRILILGENGDLYELLDVSSDNPRLEFLVIQKNVKYVNIVSLQKSYLGTLDQDGRFAILDVKTGNLACPSTLLAHHVADLASHPVLPITISCSVAGNCLLIDSSTTTRSPRITTCVHLQREALDRIKFSEKGRLFGVASFQIGRLFLLQVCIVSNESKKRVRVTSWLQLERRKMIDFLIHEMDDRSAKVLFLVGNEKSNDPRAGNEIVVYSCQLFDRNPYVENADHSIKLLSSFERLHHGRESSLEIIGIPYLTKQLHRIELKANFQDALLVEALPSLHQTRGIVIHRSKSHDSPNLITCGFDGLIVHRDRDHLRRVFNLFAAHHRAEGGCRFATLVDDAIVSLGRNGDLVANKSPYRMLGRDARDPRTTSYEGRKIERVDTIEVEEDQEAETWIEEAIRKQLMAEEREALTTRLSLLKDWDELKSRVKTLLDENEKAPPSTRLPISAFDVNKKGRELALEAAKTKERQLVRDAEERIAQLQRSTRYLRERFLDSLISRPRSIYSFFYRSKVTNYPLMQLTPREAELRSPCRFSMETRELVSRLKKEENQQTTDTENCHDFVDVFETCIVTDKWERELKEKFNERFEKTRFTKQREMRAITERVKETKRLVLELKNVFNVDASSSLFEAPDWHREEILEDSFDRDEDSNDCARPNKLDENIDCEEISTEIGSKVEDFYQKALDRMMDGVLEVRLEHNAKRRIPKPDCLRKDPSAYTEEDIRSIESYEEKIRAREIDRAKYKLMLESEIERLRDEFSKGIKSFDDELNDLAAEKMRVERSILSQKLFEMQEILRRRKIVGTKQEIRRVIDAELVSAMEEARTLAEERDLFEAGVAELRISYENARKRDKLLEDKFRFEFKELKPSMVEHLFRQYRKRPRVLAGGPCGTSPAFLAEFVLCVIERRNSDLLPRECSSYLRAIDELEAMPEGLSRRLEPDHWRLLCRLRRLKVEAETKVNSCAIELAEAEQSLAFLRNMCSTSRDKVERCKQKLEQLEKSLSDLTNDREIALLLKMKQLRIRAKGCPKSDWQDAVVISQEELSRVNQAISKAERERSVAQQRLANIKELVSLEEWHHACAKMRMEELQENAKDLDSVKVSRIVRECCQRMNCQGLSLKDEDTRIQNLLRIQQAWHRSVTERKKVRLEKITKEIRIWQRRNACSEIKINQSSIQRDEFITALRDPLRLNVAAFRTRKIRAIRKRARLARQIRDNFERLSILKNILEISKLRTYPTLKFKL